MDNKAAISQEIYAAKNRGIEKEKMQTAKRLLQTGCGTDLIVQSTDLSREQIESLRKSILEEPSAVNF